MLLLSRFRCAISSIIVKLLFSTSNASRCDTNVQCKMELNRWPWRWRSSNEIYYYRHDGKKHIDVTQKEKEESENKRNVYSIYRVQLRIYEDFYSHYQTIVCRSGSSQSLPFRNIAFQENWILSLNFAMAKKEITII